MSAHVTPAPSREVAWFLHAMGKATGTAMRLEVPALVEQLDAISIEVIGADPSQARWAELRDDLHRLAREHATMGSELVACIQRAESRARDLAEGDR